MKEQKQKSDLSDMDRQEFVKTVGLALGALGLALVPGTVDAGDTANKLPGSDKVVVSAPTKQDVQKEAPKVVIQQPKVEPTKKAPKMPSSPIRS